LVIDTVALKKGLGLNTVTISLLLHTDETRDKTYTVGEFLRADEGLCSVSGDEDQL